MASPLPSRLIDPARAAPALDSPSIGELLAFERLLAELSAGFVNLSAASVDAAITDALRRIVGLLDVDRANLIGFAPQTGESYLTHSWTVDGLAPAVLRSVSGDFPWAMQRLQSGHPIVFSRLDELPAEAAADGATWRRVGVKANLTVPMTVGGRIEGAIAIASFRRERHWSEELVFRLGILADVFGNALAYKRARESLDSAMRFERLVSGILAAVLTTDRAEDRDRVIEAGLRDMAFILGAERATLWERIGSEPRVQEDAPVARRGYAGPTGSGGRRRHSLDQRADRCRLGRPLRELRRPAARGSGGPAGAPGARRALARDRPAHGLRRRRPRTVVRDGARGARLARGAGAADRAARRRARERARARRGAPPRAGGECAGGARDPRRRDGGVRRLARPRADAAARRQPRQRGDRRAASRRPGAGPRRAARDARGHRRRRAPRRGPGAEAAPFPAPRRGGARGARPARGARGGPAARRQGGAGAGRAAPPRDRRGAAEGRRRPGAAAAGRAQSARRTPSTPWRPATGPPARSRCSRAVAATA